MKTDTTHPPIPTGLSRREVITLLLAAAAAQTCPQRISFAGSDVTGAVSSSGPSMARAAVIHDALNLLVSDRDVTGEWQDVLLPLPVGKPFEFSYAYGAASLRDDGRLVRDVVDEVRAGWDDRLPAFMDIQRHKGGMTERRFSVALGWAANHGAAPVLFDGVPGPEPELALDGAFIRAVVGADVSEAEARRVLRLLFERALIAMHTVEPDLDGWGGLDIEAMHKVKDPDQAEVNRYIDDYADWVEGIDERCAKLAKAIASTPPAAVPTGDGIYRRADPIIAAAEGLRRGQGLPSVPGRWNEDVGSSRYATAVSAAYENARLVLDAARGDRPVEDLDRL